MEANTQIDLLAHADATDKAFNQTRACSGLAGLYHSKRQTSILFQFVTGISAQPLWFDAEQKETYKRGRVFANISSFI